ncbi:MAG: DNA-directed RNA polymerase subunit beta' [Chloroflexi bacterium]|nr:DNA-directed RNA polymerase subunit beta' [Chloroflexota bacterium]
MPESNDFNAIRISLASPEQIRNWSYGEVTKPETINYRTLKPEKDGLFCERIFGPTKDFECYCGKYKRVRYKGIICDRCGVEVARSKVRRERMAHIELAAAVSHIWFAKGTPSRIGLLLDLSPRSLERVLYFAQYIVTSVDEEERKRVLEELQQKNEERVNETGSDLVSQIAAYEQSMEEALSTLQKQRQAVEKEMEEGLKAAEEEVENAASDLRKKMKPQVGKHAGQDREMLGQLLVEKGSVITADQVAKIEELASARLEEIRADSSEQRLNKTEPIDAEIESRKEEADRELNQMRRQLGEQRLEVEQESQAAIAEVEEIRPWMLLPENRYRELRESYGKFFTAGMGADAILACLKDVDLEQFREDLFAEIQSTSGQRRKKATKTLRVVEAFRRSGNDPSWMVLRVLPVLPPDLRPMVQLDGGRFATSDLNDLYRRTINRNNRLRRLLDLGAPEIIIRNEKRMLQEAVDALIDNGRRGRAIEGSHNHRLKSLSDLLRGKQGRFRQNLLGKRVDYSGRSVIIVGPELELHQCGLPKKMALELFKPLVMHRLAALGLAHNIKQAKRMVERVRPEVWDVLEDVIHNRPVFLNRAPTLHRLGIQAFQPVLIEGSAIQIHPLVCTAFNADFDGDQMAVHVPLSRAAVLEAKKLMMSTQNMLSPSSGEPVVAPTLDIVLGCYYMTSVKQGAHGEGHKFSTPEQARLNYDLGGVDLRALVHVRGVRGAEGYTETTVGRLIFNEVIPDESEIPFLNGVADKNTLKELVAACILALGNDGTAKVLDKIKTMGFHYATMSGVTIAINDIEVPKEKEGILAEADHEIVELEHQFQRGLITADERYRQTINIWTKASNTMEEVIKEHLPDYGSIYLMATSGAKGNIAQIKQMAGMRGLMTDPQGRIIELPIRASFREGLSVLEYFISTHGARKGLADTALRTANSGYLTRRLIDVSQDVIINGEDCGTLESITIIDTPNKPLMGKFEERIVGRYTAAPIANPLTGEVLVDVNEEISDSVAKQLTEALYEYRLKALKKAKVPVDDLGVANSWIESVRYLTENKKMSQEKAEEVIGADLHRVTVRSPLTCDLNRGICQKCYGRSLAKGRLVRNGEAVGIIAAQSIGEPGTQLTMRTFHTGGVAGLDITSGLPRVEELFEARSPKGQAIITEIDGQVEISEAEDSRRITVSHTETYTDEYAVPKGYQRLVDNSSLVEVGTALAKDVEVEEEANEANAIIARIAGTVQVKGRRLTISYEEREERQYLIPAASPIVVKPGQTVRAGDQLTEGPVSPQDILRVMGNEKVQVYLVEEVQKVYRAQGVSINDKHIEIVVRQMLRKVRVDDPGDADLLPGALLDRFAFEQANAKVVSEGGEPATAEPVLLGVTKASLNTESFLAAASFQETTRVLTEAAVSGAIDRLQGPKENVIIGRLIPARSEEVMAELQKPSPALSLLPPLGPDGESLELPFGGDGETFEFPPAAAEQSAMTEETPEDAKEDAKEPAPAAIEPAVEEAPAPAEERIFEPEEEPRHRIFDAEEELTQRPTES